MDRRALGRYADRLDTILSPSLRQHFGKMIALRREQSRPGTAASARPVAQIAGALKDVLADHRYELPSRLVL